MREVEILKKKQLKCYLYTRVSTSMQVDGYSLDAQRDKLRKYAAYEDMIVAGEYSDEGFSGKNIQGRQEFQRMLNDIQDGKDDVSYVLVFKLSRFGRNAADVLNSLQLMQDFGVNLICVEDGIDSSKDAGKLMISVLSAVAEIERENIRTQTMAGREQKAREGKWNGGFAPYGYKLENGNLVIAEDEVEVIRVIYDRYIHTNEGVAGVAKYLNRNGYTKKLRQNNTIPGFSRDFVKNVLYNPVYMGKIAYGRRRTEKKQGTRNEMHVVEQSEFPVYEGQHEAIISEEDWYLAQEKRKINSFKREKVNNPDHAHILSGILKCPCCGKSMYGNIAKAHSKDKKTRYYYYCKNTVTPTGHECSFRLNIEQTEINKFVAKVISAMVNNPRFVEAIQAKIGTAVDTEDMERQIAVLQGRLKQAFGTKSRLERQMDTLDINDAHYDRKILDLQRRYDEQYDTIEEIEVQIGELQSQIRSIQQEKISGDNIYRLLLAFDEVYHSATEAEQKEFMKAFIERIEMFPEKRKDGSWIKSAVDCGYIFEDLVRRFSESFGEEAGAHFTSRDIIYLMTDLLLSEADLDTSSMTVYDMAMGTSQMLSCMEERVHELNSDIEVTCFGQEFNPSTFAIAKADMMIRGGDPNNMRFGDTLSEDQFPGFTFQYIISNPPFGIDWKREQKAVEAEAARGKMGRFEPGLPKISDGQQLFVLNGLAKLANEGKMAIIQNGSPLFSGDAGSGPSNIRQYILKNDWLDCIIQLSTDMFMNTGISTYIWVLSKDKPAHRANKVQLIDASHCFEPRRKSIGTKRNDITDACRKLIVTAYGEFANGKVYGDKNGIYCESKVFERVDFGYNKIVVERPQRDEAGNVILKRGKPVPDTSLRDTENVPLVQDIDAYFAREVLPYAPDAWIDKSKTKVGYEIPMTRYFYEYQAPEAVEDIVARITALEQDISAGLAELFHKEG